MALDFGDAAKSIATLGLTSFRRQKKLETEVSGLKVLLESARGANTAALISRDFGIESVNSRPYASTANGNRIEQLSRVGARDVRTLRAIAQKNIWVEAAIRICTQRLARAKPVIRQYNRDKPLNKAVKQQIETLLSNPTPRKMTYTQMRSAAIRDYYVIGHGVILKSLNRDLTTYRLDVFDAARLGFVPDWDGNPKRPHYAIMENDGDGSRVKEWLADPQAMVFFNTPRSYSELGLSNVEVLYRSLLSILEGDEVLAKQVLMPTKSGLLNLGRGLVADQIKEVRAKIEQNDYPFVITGGLDNPQWVGIGQTGVTADQIINALVWFVRGICAIFGISTSDLMLSVDTSRANTESLSDNTDEGLITLLEYLRDVENSELVLPFGPFEEHNCYLDYPTLNQQDEAAQTSIATAQIGSGLISINDGRASLGKDPRPERIANDILIPMGKGQPPIPLSALEMQYYNPDGSVKQPVVTPAAAPTNTTTDKPGDSSNDDDSDPKARPEAADKD